MTTCLTHDQINDKRKMPIFSEETFLESLNTCCELDSISELSGFVYNKCHVTLHVTSKAQKVNLFLQQISERNLMKKTARSPPDEMIFSVHVERRLYQMLTNSCRRSRRVDEMSLFIIFWKDVLGILWYTTGSKHVNRSSGIQSCRDR